MGWGCWGQTPEEVRVPASRAWGRRESLVRREECRLGGPGRSSTEQGWPRPPRRARHDGGPKGVDEARQSQ